MRTRLTELPRVEVHEAKNIQISTGKVAGRAEKIEKVDLSNPAEPKALPEK